MNFHDDKLPERFWSKVSPEPNSGCWLWIAATVKGYGAYRLGSRRAQAHRVSYAALVGQPDAALELDHRCRNKCCVNPAHLEPVTHRVNIMRAMGELVCSRGHKRVSVGRCRDCDVIRKRNFRARRRAS